jgi:hypothetical protein
VQEHYIDVRSTLRVTADVPGADTNSRS